MMAEWVAQQPQQEASARSLIELDEVELDDDLDVEVMSNRQRSPDIELIDLEATRPAKRQRIIEDTVDDATFNISHGGHGGQNGAPGEVTVIDMIGDDDLQFLPLMGSGESLGEDQQRMSSIRGFGDLSKRFLTLENESSRERERWQSFEKKVVSMLESIKGENQATLEGDKEIYKHQVHILGSQLHEKEYQYQTLCQTVGKLEEVLRTKSQELKEAQQRQEELQRKFDNERGRVDLLETENSHLKATSGRHRTDSSSFTTAAAATPIAQVSIPMLAPSSSSSSSPPTSSSSSPSLTAQDDSSFVLIPLADIQKATSNFAGSSKIGSGPNGNVFKGELSGMAVAVKKISAELHTKIANLRAQVDLMNTAKHRHILPLLGASSFVAGASVSLVFPLMPLGSLRDRLGLQGAGPRHPLGHPAQGHHADCPDSRLPPVTAHALPPPQHQLRSANVLLDHGYEVRLGHSTLRRGSQVPGRGRRWPPLPCVSLHREDLRRRPSSTRWGSSWRSCSSAGPRHSGRRRQAHLHLTPGEPAPP